MGTQWETDTTKRRTWCEKKLGRTTEDMNEAGWKEKEVRSTSQCPTCPVFTSNLLQLQLPLLHTSSSPTSEPLTSSGTLGSSPWVCWATCARSHPLTPVVSPPGYILSSEVSPSAPWETAEKSSLPPFSFPLSPTRKLQVIQRFLFWDP